MCNGRWRWQQARCRHSPSPPADRGVTPEEGQTARQRHCLSLEGSGNTRQSSVLATQVAEAEGNGSVLASPCHPHGGGVIGREMAGLRRHGAEAGRGENGHTPSSSRTRPASGARLQPAPPTSVSYSAARDLSDRCDKSTHSSRHVTSAFAFASASFCALVTEYSWRKFFISGRATQSVAHSDTERCFRPTNGHFASAIPSNPSHLDRDPLPPLPNPTQNARLPAQPPLHHTEWAGGRTLEVQVLGEVRVELVKQGLDEDLFLRPPRKRQTVAEEPARCLHDLGTLTQAPCLAWLMPDS